MNQTYNIRIGSIEGRGAVAPHNGGFDTHGLSNRRFQQVPLKLAAPSAKVPVETP